MSKDHEYLYPYSAQEAKKRNQLPMWRESYHANVACRNAIEETIRQNFDGMHLKKDCLEPVLAEMATSARNGYWPPRCRNFPGTGVSAEQTSSGRRDDIFRRTSGTMPRSPSEVTPPYWMAS